MKKTTLFLTLLISAPALWAFSPAELTQTLQEPQNVQGNLVQQRQFKSLSKPIATSGSFTLVPQEGLLWKMQKPFETTPRMRSDGVIRRNGSQWVNSNASKLNGQDRQTRLFLDLLGGNTRGLEKQFDLKLNGNEKKWTLTLTPKTAITRQILNRIEINGDTLVRKIELDEKQGDKTTMQSNQIQTDKALDNFSRTAL